MTCTFPDLDKPPLYFGLSLAEQQFGVGRAIERFPQIVTRLAGMTERFLTILDCVTTGFLADGTLDQLPLPSRIGRTRTGGIDLNRPRIRAALTAVLALSAAPAGFTVADLAAKVQTMAGQRGYTIRQAAYDLRKLRGKDLLVKPGRSHRYQVPPPAARTIATLLALRDQVIGPLLAGVRSPRLGRKPAHWTAIDRDYESLRIGMQALFADLGITTSAAARSRGPLGSSDRADYDIHGQLTCKGSRPTIRETGPKALGGAMRLGSDPQAWVRP
ncbi:MAG TPA: hypothetical protein VE776_01325 [Actinomycetota bacterium]|nr:hypothetical protein [Actinomycetota bacterium]